MQFRIAAQDADADHGAAPGVDDDSGLLSIGSEFMPPLYEGSLLYMPTTMPGISVAEAQRLLQTMDKQLRKFPEVERVFGKAGRAETSTDPAPLSMVETTIVLKPTDQWRKADRWYSDWPDFLQAPLRHIWPDRISPEQLIAEMNQAMQFPGVTNAWTMPIKARIDMLSTGIRTPVGIKIQGADPKEIERIGIQLESILSDVPGTRSAFAERTAGGYFLDFTLKRDKLARYGLTIKDAEMVVQSAIGGEAVSTTVEGRERYTINVRYARDFREDLTKLRRVLVPTMSGAQIPLAELADIEIVSGPAMLRDENGMLTGYVYVDIAGRDMGGYVEDAKKAVAREVLASDRLYADLERPVRKHAARSRATENRAALHAIPDLHAALHEHQIGRQGGDRHVGRALLPDRRGLVFVVAGLSHFDRRLGGHDCPDGPGRRNRRFHVAVPRPLLQ